MAYLKDKKKSDKEEQPVDQQIVTKVNEDFARAYRAKLPKELLFREVYRRYRSYLEVSQSTSRSSLFIPESFTLVETVAPRMTAKKPSWKVLPRESSDITLADTIGQLLEYQYDTMEMQSKLKTFVKQGLIYGTSFMKVGWGDNQPCIEPVDIADIWGDDEASDWYSGFVIHRYYATYDELKSSKIKYKNLEQLKMKGKTTNVRDDQMRQDRMAIQSIPFEPNRKGSEILEWWGWVDGKLKVRAIADRTVCIRDDDNPNPLDQLPFICFYDQAVPFEKWGIGEIEPILDLQDEENTTRNQRIDEKNLSIHNMWIVSKLAGIDYRTLISKPGGIVLANDINGIKPLEKQNITQDSIEEIRMIKNDIQNTTGVNDYIRGADTGATTATETVTKTQEANQRFNEKMNNLEIALRLMGRWIIALDAAFLPKDIEIRILGKYGPQIEKIKLADIKKEYDIDIEAGSSLPSNPDLRRQQLTQLLQVIAPFLTNPNGIPDGLRELLRTIIQSYDLKNADDILQGAEHPLVNQALATLDTSETDGTSMKMVQQIIKQRLMAEGRLAPIAEPGQAPMATPVPEGGQANPMGQPAQPIPEGVKQTSGY